MHHELRKAIICSSLASKIIGLMFSSKKTLVFAFERDEHIPLHTLFVFFPIHVFYLDKDKKVIETKTNFKPFSFYNPKFKARYVVEVSERSSFKIGDVLIF